MLHCCINNNKRRTEEHVVPLWWDDTALDGCLSGTECGRRILQALSHHWCPITCLEKYTGYIYITVSYFKNEKNLKEERLPPGDSIRRAWENYLVIKNPFYKALTDSFPRVVCHSHGGWSQMPVRGQKSLISRSLPSLREYKEYARVSTHKNES